jgi:hypothetical protein
LKEESFGTPIEESREKIKQLANIKEYQKFKYKIMQGKKLY